MNRVKRLIGFSTSLVMIITFIVSVTGCSAKEFFAKSGDTETLNDPSKDGVITNAEWLAMVNDAFGMQVDETDEDGELNAAKDWGVIEEGETVDMDSPVTDQFATKTLMRASGFVGSGASDEEIIQAAVSHGIITPDSADISKPQRAAEAISSTVDSWAHQTYEYFEDVKYAENVQDLSQKVESSSVKIDSDDTVVIPTSSASGIGTNSVFILPPGDKYEKGIALKAVSVTDNGDGTTTIKSVPASRDDLYSDIFVQGSFNPDSDGIVSYDKDAEIVVRDKATGMSFKAPHGYEGGVMPLSVSENNAYIKQLKTTEYNQNGCSLSISKEIDGVKYSVGVDDIHLNAKIDYTVTKVKELRAAVDYKTTFGIEHEIGKFEKTFEPGGHNYFDDAEAVAAVYKIGNVSFTVYYGISVDFTVYLVISASGAVSVEISQNHTKGFEWKNDNFRTINEAGTPEVSFKLSGEVGLNLKLELSLNLYLIKNVLEHKLFAVSISAGPRLSGEVTVRNDMTCISVTGYLGIDFEVELNLIFKKYSAKIGIWTSGNSPVKFLDLHYEVTMTQGFHKVDACTHGAEETTPAVTSAFVPDGKLALQTTYLSLGAGSSTVIGIKSSPVDISQLRWESSDSSVVSVDSTGKITTKQKNGSAIITVRTPDGKQSAKCTVKVNADIMKIGAYVSTDDFYPEMMCA